MQRSEWLLGLIYVLVLALLPLAGHWSRQGALQACAFDGVRIEPLFQVRIVDGRGKDHRFCCIHCADLWLKNARIEPRAIFVTDEVEGVEVEADDAFFVSSTVVTMPTTGNRIHAFRDRAAADRHAAAYRGRLLPDAEKPFAGAP